jgi:hypothetical protein
MRMMPQEIPHLEISLHRRGVVPVYGNGCVSDDFRTMESSHEPPTIVLQQSWSPLSRVQPPPNFASLVGASRPPESQWNA